LPRDPGRGVANFLFGQGGEQQCGERCGRRERVGFVHKLSHQPRVQETGKLLRRVGKAALEAAS